MNEYPGRIPPSAEVEREADRRALGGDELRHVLDLVRAGKSEEVDRFLRERPWADR